MAPSGTVRLLPAARAELQRHQPARLTASAVVVQVRGEIDVDEAHELREAINAAIRQRPRQLVIDLTEVEFFGTPAVGVLVEASTLRPDLGLVCSKMISRILRVMGFGNWFSANSSVTAALDVEDR